MYRNKMAVCVHFVWATWNRLPYVDKDIERELYRYIPTVCAEQRCEVPAVGGMPDHVHLLVLMPPIICIADLMKRVKGSFSRYISAHLKPGERFAWQRHYGAFSVSASHKDRIKSYIRNQERHHADNTTLVSAEETCEEIPVDELHSVPA